jgi:hypothetical protein
MKNLNNAHARNRATTLIIAAIALFLISAIVYAAVSGVLTIGGTTTTQANTDVIFTDVRARTGTAFVDTEFSVSADGHSITYSANLTEPDTASGVNYSIKNIGSTNARVYAPAITYDSSEMSYGTTVDNKVRIYNMFLVYSNSATSNASRTLSYYASNLGLTASEFIEEQTTDEYITIVPGAIMTSYTSFQWGDSDSDMPPGECETTVNMNFEAAT